MIKYQQISKRISNFTRILDFGCGVGILGRHLDGKQCEVTGWDLRLTDTEDYEEYYFSMVERNVEKEGLGKEKYDAIIFSDVLEHLNNGGKVFRQSRDILTAGGKVILSLPNVAYFENRLRLFMGNWDYTDDGILDRTHIRFYTLETARDLIADAGFTIVEMEPEIPIIHSAWKRNLFSFLSRNFPSLFAIGWVFEVVPIELNS